MNSFKSIFILIALAVCLQTLCQEQTKAKVTGVREDAKSKNIQLPNLPWHMMCIYWDFKDPIPDFKRLDIDITIDRDISSAYNLYISPVNSAFNEETFYGGLQTNINGWKSKEDHRRVHAREAFFPDGAKVKKNLSAWSTSICLKTDSVKAPDMKASFAVSAAHIRGQRGLILFR